MTGLRTFTWQTCGRRPEIELPTQEVFQKDAPEEVRAQYRKHARGNSLFRNTGGRFQDASASAGVEMGRWSWSSDAWDFDHDGFPDLYITNGMVSGPSRADLNSFFWRQVVAHSPREAKPKSDYEQGWNAINELIRSDAAWSGSSGMSFTQTIGMEPFPTSRGSWGWTSSRTAGRSRWRISITMDGWKYS